MADTTSLENLNKVIIQSCYDDEECKKAVTNHGFKFVAMSLRVVVSDGQKYFKLEGERNNNTLSELRYMKILLIHHLEPTWSEAYMRVGGITFEKLCKKTAKHIKKNEYSKVILTQFEPIDLRECYPYEPLIGKIDEVHEYGYGWEVSMFADGDNGFTKELVCDASAEILTGDEVMERLEAGETYTNRWGVTITLGGNHSQVVEVPEWLSKLTGHEVSLCGAFRGECIEDMEIALSAANVTFNLLNNLII